MAYGTVNADVIGTSVTGSNLGAGNASAMKNRIINGAMVIDQRNAGASVTPTATPTYLVDRFRVEISKASKFSVQQNAGSVTPPVGFTNYLGITSLSAYSSTSTDYFILEQVIEGFNTADLGWGTANAKTVTLSFQVRSSLTGSFSGALENSAGNRTYPFSYSIPAANTWTTISVTVAGDTTGTWLTNNGIGMFIKWNLGSGSTRLGTAGAWAATNYDGVTGSVSIVGTSGATFYITGVQLEVGSSATGFEYRQYGTELALCQRYYNKWSGANSAYIGLATALLTGGTTPSVRRVGWANPVDFRAAPTLGFGGSIQLYTSNLTNLAFTGFNGASKSSKNIISFDANSTSAGTAGQCAMFIIDTNLAANYIDASAEL